MKANKLTLNSIKEKRAKLEILNEIKNEMLLSNIYHKKANFVSFNDSIFTYEYKNKSTIYEFSFICDDFLLSKLTIKELLELKNIEFFENNIYYKDNLEKIGSKTFNKNEDNLFYELTKDFDDDLKQDFNINGFYLSDGCYLMSDGSIKNEIQKI